MNTFEHDVYVTDISGLCLMDNEHQVKILHLALWALFQQKLILYLNASKQSFTQFLFRSRFF